MIQAGFVDLNRQSFEKQDMTWREFHADMTSPDVIKVIAYDKQDAPVGCMTVHIGLDQITWVDRDLLEEQQRTLGVQGPPYYLTTFVVVVRARRTAVARNLVQAALLHARAAANARGLCFFDCSAQNVPGLPRFIEHCALPSPRDNFAGLDITIREIGREYWISPDGTPAAAIKVKGLPVTLPPAVHLDTQYYYALYR